MLTDLPVGVATPHPHATVCIDSRRVAGAARDVCNFKGVADEAHGWGCVSWRLHRQSRR
jgi:hypothetical protein